MKFYEESPKEDFLIKALFSTICMSQQKGRCEILLDKDVLEDSGEKFSEILVEYYEIKYKERHKDLLMDIVNVFRKLDLKNNKKIEYETLVDVEKNNKFYIFERFNPQIRENINKAYNLVLLGILKGVLNIFEVKYYDINLKKIKNNTVFTIEFEE